MPRHAPGFGEGAQACSLLLQRHDALLARQSPLTSLCLLTLAPCGYASLGSELLRIAVWGHELGLDCARRLLDLPRGSLEESLPGLNALLEEVEAIGHLYRIGHSLARRVGVGSAPIPADDLPTGMRFQPSSGVASKFGVHRRQVRQALQSAAPPQAPTLVRPSPSLEPAKDFIEAILVADKSAPRKQRHTAHRIWVRLCQERAQHPVAESTVRAYVRERKWSLGLCGKETYIPQDYAWGQEAQVDWYEAYVMLDGERVKVQIVTMRSMKSGGAYQRAYLHATQQAFFEAHEHAFAYFGGVFHLLRYDNVASAVTKVLRGHTREEHTRFIEFRSQWQFRAEFCGPAQPQEKGGVEGEVGTFRRNHLVPVPEAADLEAFNRKLLADGIADPSRPLSFPHSWCYLLCTRRTFNRETIDDEVLNPCLYHLAAGI